MAPLLRPLALLGMAALLCVGLAASAATPARANGVAQLVKLEYLPGVSNWGPEEAEGLLEFSFAEAYARVDVKNLSAPADVEFEGWMQNDEGDQFFVGKIPVDEAGIGRLDTKLDGLTQFDYNLFVVGARTANDDPGALPGQISIAGAFTVIDETEDGAGADSRPQVLPNTGEAPAGSGPGRGFVAMMAMAVTGFALVLVAQIRKRRRT